MAYEVDLGGPTQTISERLSLVSYDALKKFLPSAHTLEFMNFIKLVNADDPEENKTPILHYVIAESLFSKDSEVANLAHRGSGKTALCEYYVLYIAAMGGIPNIPKINTGIFIGANESAYKQFKENLELRIAGSSYLQKLIPSYNFTINEWYMTNLNGQTLKFWAFGAQTPFRGKRLYKSRPQIAILDDVIDEKDARSDIIINRVLNTVTGALRPAMHPTSYKIIWNGTPYNSRDPLYRSIESGAWKANVFPIAEKFPCPEEEFKGSWSDRFPYDSLLKKYIIYKKEGKLSGFFAEYMLDIVSEDSKLIKDSDIQWYSLDEYKDKLIKSSVYITTDFATSEKESADFSTINVWSYANLDGDFKWYWLDGYCDKSTMDFNIDKLFQFVREYSPYQVGVEASGTQGGFISWILREQRKQNTYFNLAKGKSTNIFNVSDNLGLNPTGSKFERFLINSVPLLKLHKIIFPLDSENSPEVQEFITEIAGVTVEGFKALHDDQLDNITMLNEFDLLEIHLNNNESLVKIGSNIKTSNIFKNRMNSSQGLSYDII